MPHPTKLSPVAEVAQAGLPENPGSGGEAGGRPGRWFLLALLFVGLVFNYVHRTSLSLAGPAIMKELHLSTAALGVLLSAFFWPYSLLQVPLGWLSDRFGVKHLYGLSYAFWCLACAATAFASSLGFLLVMRILLGVGQAAVFPASTRAVAVWFSPAQRGTATGLYTAGVRVGMILLTAVGALILAAYGWQMLFLLSGLAGLPFLLGWYAFFRHFGEERASAAGKSPPSPGDSKRRSVLREFLSQARLLRFRAAWGVSLGFLCYDYAWYVYATWLPGYLMIERKFSLQQTGFYGSLPLLSMSLAMPLAGILSDRLIRRGHDELRVRKGFVVGGLLLACLIVPAGLVNSPYKAVALLTVSLAGLGFVGPNTWTITAAVAPRHLVGTLAGLQNFWGNLGGIAAPAVTGYIAHLTGSFAIALGFTGAMLVLGCVFYLFLIPGKITLEESTQSA